MSEPRWRRALRMHGPDPRADVDDEFAHHIDERTEALMAKGMTERAARERALQQFGDLERAADTCTDIGSRRVRRGRWSERFESVWQDLVYALRGMRRSSGFTVAAVSTIALGIGANAAVFSLLNVLLLQPLDAAKPDELVRIYTSEGHGIRTDRDRLGASSYADYLDLRQSRALAGLAAHMPLGAAVQLSADAPASRAQARVVSENYFAVLGRPLLLGGWTSDDDAAGFPQAIVSHRFWERTLGGDSSVLGREIIVNRLRVRVAGVTAASFKGIEPSTVDLYFPFRSAPELTGRRDVLADRSERSVKLIGRLAPDATPQSAERSLDGIMTALGAEFPASNARRAIAVRRATSVVPLELAEGMLPSAGLIFGATLVMLAIAGVNVAAILLARTIRRRRELALRMSLGASASRVVRQLVTESVALALVAGAVVVALVSLLPLLADRLGVPPAIQPDVDATVLAYAVAVALVFGVVFGLGPALAGIRADVVESLRGGASNTRPAKAWAQRALVCTQLALSMLLLLVGGALLASLDRQQRVDPGFTTAGVVVADFEDPSGTQDRTHEQELARLVNERLSGVPGVVSATVASMAPLSGDGMRSTIHIPGYAESPDENMEVWMVTAAPDFFRTLRIAMRSGRELKWSDRDTLPRVVVNRAMALKYWGDRDPVGTFVRLGGERGTPAEVIGVSADTRFRSLNEPPQPMYVVQRATWGGTTVLVRTSGEPSATMLAVRGSLSRNDVPMALVRVQSMEEVLRGSLVVTRAVSNTLMTIGLLAVLLASVGLYGVVSYVTTGRTREFGVRLALGASPASITRLVLAYGMRLTVIGALIGTVLGLVALRFLSGMLFEARSSVPSALAVALVLGLVTLVASAIPAARATATSPASALRAD